MRVYTLTTDSGNPLIVGWDGPMGTFVGQVDPSQGTPTLWVGETPFSAPTVHALSARLAEYVTLPEEIRQQLAWERQQEPPTFGEGPMDYVIYESSREAAEVTPRQVAAMEEALQEHGRI